MNESAAPGSLNVAGVAPLVKNRMKRMRRAAPAMMPIMPAVWRRGLIPHLPDPARMWIRGCERGRERRSRPARSSLQGTGHKRCPRAGTRLCRTWCRAMRLRTEGTTSIGAILLAFLASEHHNVHRALLTLGLGGSGTNFHQSLSGHSPGQAGDRLAQSARGGL